MYSTLVNPAADILSSSIGCSFTAAKEHIEDVIFNTECSAKDFLLGIFNMNSAPEKIKNIKGQKRDFWKKPGDVQMRIWLGMTPEEYEEFEALSRSDIPEERLAYWADRGMFWDEADKWQGRHYARLNECGIWWDKYTTGFYGILTKQQKRERNWKEELRRELAEEGVRPLRMHG